MNPMMATPVLMPPPSEGGVRMSAEWLLWSLSLAMMAPLVTFFETTTMPLSTPLERERCARAICLIQ